MNLQEVFSLSHCLLPHSPTPILCSPAFLCVCVRTFAVPSPFFSEATVPGHNRCFVSPGEHTPLLCRSHPRRMLPAFPAWLRHRGGHARGKNGIKQ